MYVVRNRKSTAVIHVNHAPLSQELSGKEVYFKFNPNSMEIGKSDLPEMPEQFHIDKKGMIVELSLQEKVECGIVELKPEEKAEGNEIVEKSLSERVADGLISLEPGQKLTGEEIVSKTTREMLDEGLIALEKYKQDRTNYYSRLAFEKRSSLIKDYKLLNVALGIYDSKTTANYRATVQAFRDEFYRIKKIIKEAKTVKRIDGIREGFPKKIVTAKAV